MLDHQHHYIRFTIVTCRIGPPPAGSNHKLLLVPSVKVAASQFPSGERTKLNAGSAARQ